MASGSKSNETAGSQLTLEQEQTFIVVRRIKTDKYIQIV